MLCLAMTQRTVAILSFLLFAVGLLWGGYTLLVYMGIPMHTYVYLLPAELKSITHMCEEGTSMISHLCQGTALTFPFLLGEPALIGTYFVAFFQMSSPFAPYMLCSFLGFAGILIVAGYRTGSFSTEYLLRPGVFIGFFALSVWLLATTLSITSLNNLRSPEHQLIVDPRSNETILPPFRFFYEPVPDMFNGDHLEAYRELRTNYEELLADGCLNPVTNQKGEALATRMGGAVYTISTWCMQRGIMGRIGTQMILLMVLLLNMATLGRCCVRGLFRLQSLHPLTQLCLSLALGALGWVVILWTLGVLGFLTPTVTLLFFIGLPCVLFPWTWELLQEVWRPSVRWECSLRSIQTFLVWLLISYLALNFLNVVRPFPIGWDDLGSYLNRPRLLASYGSFIPSMSQFQWEYLSALPFAIFGYESIVGATMAMEINWMAGLLATLAVYAVGRMFFGRNAGVLSALLYYTLPMVGHFSFADMKIDNAAFFTAATSILIVMSVVAPKEDKAEEVPTVRTYGLLCMAGIVAGFCFGIKPTGILAIILCVSLIAGMMGGRWCFASTAVFGFVVLSFFGAIQINDVLTRIGFPGLFSPATFQIVVALLSAVLIIIAWMYDSLQKRWLHIIMSIASFGLGIGIAVAPWMLHNMFLHRVVSVATALSAPDTTAPVVFYQQEEEVRKMGLPSTVPWRALPQDLKLNPHDAACLANARVEELDRYWGFSNGFSHYATLVWRQVMNTDAFGYYVTFIPALLLFPLLLLLPYFWGKEGRWLRYLCAGTAVFVVQWIFVGNGIAWYGIAMFLGLSIALEALVIRAPDDSNRWLFAIFIAASLSISLINRLWQFDSQKNIYEYALGKISGTAMQEVTMPDYNDISSDVVKRHETLKETPFTYRMGTFISYFVPRNREIFPLADNQMTFFNCLNQERNHQLTLRRLKALGFNSMIFDTNTATIEKDENGSLHRKVAAFYQFIDDPSLGITFPVRDPANGIIYLLLP